MHTRLIVLTVAMLAAAGCGPRTTPDASLRPVPAKTEPSATLRIDVQPQALATDTSFALPMTMALLPVASAFTPGIGGDGIASNGGTTSDDSLTYHNCGLGIGFYITILPYFCGLPNKSYSMESAAVITLTRADGATLLRRDYTRDQWWSGSKYSADDAINQPASRYPLNAATCGREVAYLVARDVAAAIAADQAAAKAKP